MILHILFVCVILLFTLDLRGNGSDQKNFEAAKYA